MKTKPFSDLRRFLLLLAAAMVLPSAVAANSGPYTGGDSAQTLAKVGDRLIRVGDLEQAMASSPLSTSFVSMEAEDQARVRGDMLKRLIASELLYLEALDSGVDKTDLYRSELNAYRAGLLAQYYLSNVRTSVEPPPGLAKALEEKFGGDADALDAATSAYVAQQYPDALAQAIADARVRYGLNTWPERIAVDAPADTVLAQGDGILIRLADITGGLDAEVAVSRMDQLRRRLDESAETLLMARAGQDVGIEVESKVAQYAHDLAARLLLRNKQSEWIPDEKAKREWFAANPDVGKVATRWHVGQIVLASRREADAVLQRIRAGESLFALAGELSIDPVGRKNNGDLGWVREGTGVPEVEQALDALDDAEVSEVIETPMGFHILTVLERRPGEQKSYEEVHDRVTRAMIAAKLPDYVLGLQKKHGVYLNPQ